MRWLRLCVCGGGGELVFPGDTTNKIGLNVTEADDSIHFQTTPHRIDQAQYKNNFAISLPSLNSFVFYTD